MEFYISPQSGQFYMINVLENQWLSVTLTMKLRELSTVDGATFDSSPTEIPQITLVWRKAGCVNETLLCG